MRRREHEVKVRRTDDAEQRMKSRLDRQTGRPTDRQSGAGRQTYRQAGRQKYVLPAEHFTSGEGRDVANNFLDESFILS